MSPGPSRRVLCLTSWYPPHHFGGYEASCRDVMSGLRERGHDVRVLTSDHRHDDVVDGDGDDDAVERRLRLYFRDGDLWTPSIPHRVLVERHNRRVMVETLDRFRPDVVSVWHVGAMSLGLLDMIVERGIPVVFAVSDEWPVYAPRLDPWTRTTLYRPRLGRGLAALAGLSHGLPAIGDAGPFCFISEITRAKCVASSPWEFATSAIVYSGMDHDFFASSPDVQPPGDAPSLLYVGRVDERKGIRTLIRALGDIDGARLVIDGRASDADARRVADWAQDAGVADRVTVQCSDRSQLPSVYGSATVCVFPSEWEEPFGLVPLEAMAAGTPVVASGVGGSGEFLVDGHNAALFRPGDASSLTAALRRVLDDAALRDRLVGNGRDTAAFFDASHLTDCFAEWHEYAITGHTRPRDRVPPRGHR